MNINMFPTKGNLIAAKNSLALARQGYDLMDKKRNILVREMMDLVDQASTIQTEIDTTFRAAYEALQQANIEMGIHMVQDIAKTVPVENTVKIKTRSIMGTEIPLVEYDKEASEGTPNYAFYSTRVSLDEAQMHMALQQPISRWVFYGAGHREDSSSGKHCKDQDAKHHRYRNSLPEYDKEAGAKERRIMRSAAPESAWMRRKWHSIVLKS